MAAQKAQTAKKRATFFTIEKIPSLPSSNYAMMINSDAKFFSLEYLCDPPDSWWCMSLAV